MKPLWVAATLALTLAACTEGAEVGQPAPPTPTGPCAEVARIDPSTQEAQALVADLPSSIEALPEEATAERMTAVVEVDDWVALGVEIRESDFAPGVFLGEPVGQGGRDYSLAWIGSGIDPEQYEGGIPDAIEEAGNAIRESVASAVSRALENSEVPEHLLPLAECLEIPAWLARGRPPPATAKERAIVENLRLFARSGDHEHLAAVPFSGGGVLLGLGPELLVQRSAEELREFSSWRLEMEGFRAYVGPFNPLDFFGDPRPQEVTVGPHPHCASPPMAAPEEVEDLHRFSVQPSEAESCLEWYTVDLFLTRRGEIAAITMDLYEP